MRRARVPTLPAVGETLTLPEDVAHYLIHVLRLRHDTVVELFDGDGARCEVRLLVTADSKPSCVGQSPLTRDAPTYGVHLILGFLKGPAMDLAVRQATEVGVTHIHTLRLTRSVPKAAKLERWQRIASEAARQCGRSDVPQVTVGTTLNDALGALQSVPRRYVAVPGGGGLTTREGDAAVLIGPEGGLTTQEVQTAQQHGFEPISLGRWVLRASTAVPVAIARVSPQP